MPLGATYLELVRIVDEAEAARSAFGRWVAAARSGAPFGWAVRTDDLDAVAARLGLTVRDGARQAPDGRRLTWRMAGIEQAAAEPSLPFVIEWGAETPFPGAAASNVEVGLELRGDAQRSPTGSAPTSRSRSVRARRRSRASPVAGRRLR